MCVGGGGVSIATYPLVLGKDNAKEVGCRRNGRCYRRGNCFRGRWEGKRSKDGGPDHNHGSPNIMCPGICRREGAGELVRRIPGSLDCKFLRPHEVVSAIAGHRNAPLRESASKDSCTQAQSLGLLYWQ